LNAALQAPRPMPDGLLHLLTWLAWVQTEGAEQRIVQNAKRAGCTCSGKQLMWRHQSSKQLAVVNILVDILFD